MSSPPPLIIVLIFDPVVVKEGMVCLIPCSLLSLPLCLFLCYFWVSLGCQHCWALEGDGVRWKSGWQSSKSDLFYGLLRALVSQRLLKTDDAFCGWTLLSLISCPWLSAQQFLRGAVPMTQKVSEACTWSMEHPCDEKHWWFRPPCCNGLFLPYVADAPVTSHSEKRNQSDACLTPSKLHEMCVKPSSLCFCTSVDLMSQQASVTRRDVIFFDRYSNIPE
jgi:hypothetical protein